MYVKFGRKSLAVQCYHSPSIAKFPISEQRLQKITVKKIVDSYSDR